MAAQRSSLKRKPFSDCTNTFTARADTVRRKTSLRSALNQPLKSSSENNYENPIGSLKSNTSTGSNSPLISESTRSTLLPASYGSEKQETKKRKDRAKERVEEATVVQPDNQETVKRNDKGKAVAEDTLVNEPDHQETVKRKDKEKAVAEDIVIIQPDHQETGKRKDKGKSVIGDTETILPDYRETRKWKDKGKSIVEDNVVILPDYRETRKWKDKGKAVVEDIVIIQPDHQETGKRKDKGKSIVEDTEIILPDYRETRKWKDKGKTIVEDDVVILPDYRDTRKCKDKGKAVVEDTAIILPDSANEETGKRKDEGKSVVEDTEIILPDYRETRKWKDKGKAVVEDTAVILPDIDYNEEIRKRKNKGIKIVENTTVFQPDHRETIKKDKRKAVIEDTTVFQPETPSATVSGSSYDGLFKFRTVYTRKRAPEARNLRSLKITEPFSCPPLKRLKVKGEHFSDGGGDNKFLLQRKSFTAQKKKPRGKFKHEAVGGMPKEEVEKLKKYFADIDAFELDVEEANGDESVVQVVSVIQNSISWFADSSHWFSPIQSPYIYSHPHNFIFNLTSTKYSHKNSTTFHDNGGFTILGFRPQAHQHWGVLGNGGWSIIGV